MRIAVSFLLALSLCLLFVGCTSPKEVTIRHILENPNNYVGEKVTLRGTFLGWKADSPPPVSRGDWVLSDGTGKIYITGAYPDNFDPVKDVGRNVTVTSYVEIKNGIVYIKALKVVPCR